jgi:hypothetical protein
MFGICNSGISNFEKASMAGIWAALSTAVAAYNTGQAIYFADKQYEIAKDNLNMSKWWRTYDQYFFEPVENQELTESYALGEEPPLYDIAEGRSQVAARIKYKGYANAKMQCTSEYCTGLRQKLLRDALADEARTVVDTATIGYRNERAFVETRSDVRWKRLMGTVARGRGMAAQAPSFQRLSTGIYGHMFNDAVASGAGAWSAAGYWMNRNYIGEATFKRTVPDPNASPNGPRFTVDPQTGGWSGVPQSKITYTPRS